MTKFGNAEMHYIPVGGISTDEVHTPHTFWCCWSHTAIEVLTMLGILAGVALVVWLFAINIHQLYTV